MPDADIIESDSEFHNIVRAVARFCKERNVANASEPFAAVSVLISEAVLIGRTAHVYDDGAVEY